MRERTPDAVSSSSARPHGPINTRLGASRETESSPLLGHHGVNDGECNGQGKGGVLERIEAEGGRGRRIVHKVKKLRKPSGHQMAVVAGMANLGAATAVTSTIKVYQALMCDIYNRHYASNPTMTLLYSSLLASRSFIPDEPLPYEPYPDNCNTPPVAKLVSSYLAIITTISNILSVASLGALTRVSNRWGRKPVIALCLTLVLIEQLGFRLSLPIGDYFGAILLAFAAIIGDAALSAGLNLGIEQYVVDTTPAAKRSSVLSFITGTGLVGGAPATALGGWTAALSQNFFTPFYIAMSCVAFTLAWTIFIVPESLRREPSLHAGTPTSDGDESRRCTSETPYDTPDDSRPTSPPPSRLPSHGPSAQARLRRLFNALNVLEPLSIFIPRLQVESGVTSMGYGYAVQRRNWRLPLLGIIAFFEALATGFLPQLLQMYGTTRFGYGPKENGYLLFTLMATRAAFLSLVFPVLITWVRRSVSRRLGQSGKDKEEDGQRKYLRSTPSDEDPDDEDTAETDGTNGDGADNSENDYDDDDDDDERASAQDTQTTPDRLDKVDVSVLVVGFACDVVSFLLIAWAGGWAGLIVGLVIFAGGGPCMPVRTALISSSVEDHERSRAIAANRIIWTLATAITPLISSSIYSLGLSLGAPNVVWLYCAGCCAISALASFSLLAFARL